MLDILEAYKDGKLMCTYKGEATFPSKEEIKSLKAAGYKLYQDGRLYKPDMNKK